MTSCLVTGHVRKGLSDKDLGVCDVNVAGSVPILVFRTGGAGPGGRAQTLERDLKKSPRAGNFDAMSQNCTPRYTLVHEPHHVIIRDEVLGLNVFFLAESGFGPKTSDIELAERVVGYLNAYEPQTPVV